MKASQLTLKAGLYKFLPKRTTWKPSFEAFPTNNIATVPEFGLSDKLIRLIIINNQGPRSQEHFIEMLRIAVYAFIIKAFEKIKAYIYKTDQNYFRKLIYVKDGMHCRR